MKNHFLSFLILLITQMLSGQENVTYTVLSVSPGKVFYANKAVKTNQKLTLKGILPYFPKKEFFVDNQLKFEKNAELILRKGRRQYILSYNDFIGKNQSRVTTMNSNGSTRGSNNPKFNCSNVSTDDKFHLLSFTDQPKKIGDMSCLKQYLSAGSYSTLYNDTLQLSNSSIQGIRFNFGQRDIIFKNIDNQIVIENDLMPETAKVQITIITENENLNLDEGTLFNFNKIIQNFRDEGYSIREIGQVLIDGPLKDFNINDDQDKAVIANLADFLNNLE